MAIVITGSTKFDDGPLNADILSELYEG